MASTTSDGPLTGYFAQRDMGNVYKLGEQITRTPGLALILQSGLPKASKPSAKGDPIKILDNASGPAVLTRLILNPEHGFVGRNFDYSDLKITSGDYSQSMVDAAKQKVNEMGWSDIVETKVIDAQAIDCPDDHFDYVFTNIAMQSIPRADVALREMIRVAKRGTGIVSFSNWILVGWVAPLREALQRIPGAPQAFLSNMDPPMGRSGAWYDKQYIQSQLQLVEDEGKLGGLRDIVIERFDFTVDFAIEEDVQEFAKATEGLIVMLFAAAWTDDERRIMLKDEKTLSDEVADCFRDEVAKLEGRKMKWAAFITTCRRE